MEKAGCPVQDNFFKAINCDQNHAGGYVPGEGVRFDWLIWENLWKQCMTCA